MKQRSAIGIVGGLGPLATADIYSKTMKQVKATCGDADYPDIIISVALDQKYRGNQYDDSPKRNYDMVHRILYIYQVCKELKQRGVGRILIPDFLSYSYARTISCNIQLPLVDIVKLLADEVRRKWPEVSKVGLLTTTLAVEQRIFEQKFIDNDLHIVYPDPDVQQNMVMEAIYGEQGAKQGFTRGKAGELIREACRHLSGKGAELIVAAVTELPLIERDYYPEDNYLDCNEVIAHELAGEGRELIVDSGQSGIIGILGGLGPAATVDLFDKIVRNTPVSADQDHLKVIVENNPQIPDRTAALRQGAEDPSVAMLATAEKLVDSRADFIIVPCNTAHAFLPPIRQHIKVPILSMIEETVNYVIENLPEVKKIGLLATTGTVGSGIYEKAFRKKNLELLVPSPETQENCVMQAIYGANGIKAGNASGLPREQLLTAARELICAGAQAIIMGCTEIPLALKDAELQVPLLDPTDVLARTAVEYAMSIGKTLPKSEKAN